MVLQLHVWGSAFGLPSIDAECIATIGYMQKAVPRGEWMLIADHDSASNPQGKLPMLIDGHAKANGFTDIISYLRNHSSEAYDLDAELTQEQQRERTAFISFLHSTAVPLLDLYLFVSSENYYNGTTSAYTAILPWYLNYTVPPTRRDLARARTAHLGVSGLDVNSAEEGSPVSRTPGSEFEAAKRAAGLSSGNRPADSLNLGRGKGIGGLFSSPVHAARFRLDALSNALLEPLSDLLATKKYLLGHDQPSSLDCLVFGSVSLMLYPSVPQAWLQEAIKARPRLHTYISRMREELLGSSTDVLAEDIWAITSGVKECGVLLSLPWHRAPNRGLSAANALRELVTHFPVVSKVFRSKPEYQYSSMKPAKRVSTALPSPLALNTLLTTAATVVAGFTAFAIHQRRNPREGELIFWALRPNLDSRRFGEAGNTLSVLAHQLPATSRTAF